MTASTLCVCGAACDESTRTTHREEHEARLLVLDFRAGRPLAMRPGPIDPEDDRSVSCHDKWGPATIAALSVVLRLYPAVRPFFEWLAARAPGPDGRASGSVHSYAARTR